MARPTVVVTRRIPSTVEQAIASKYDARFNSNEVPMTAAQLAEAMQYADALLCTLTDKITAEHLHISKRRVRIVANFGAGYNNIDLEAAKKAGVVITNTPDVLTEDTADFTIALLLMAMRRLGEGERHLRTGAWSGWRPTHMLGQSPRGKTLGVVGYGRIGRAVAKRAASMLDMEVLWFAPRDPVIADPAHAGPPNATRVATLEELLRRSDVVTLHCPASPETRHLIGMPQFMMMKPSAVLINTARGDVVDEHALVHALREQLIAGAGIDVYEFEPTVLPDLRDFERAVLLPHLGSATIETRTAMGNLALANLDAFFEGKEPPTRVA